MTAKEFNEKYKDYLQENHYGLDLRNLELIEWLDLKFQDFIKKPGFTYTQIKCKFGYGRFYCEGLCDKDVIEVENKISQLEKN
jgi:hypothetical protein